MNLASTSVLNALKLRNPKLVLLESCSSFSHLKILHSHMIRTHLIFDDFTASRLISLCIDSEFATGLLDYAFRVFSQISNPNIFIYNSLIRGFSSSESPLRAFDFYTQLLKSGLFPDNLTFPFLVKACTQLEFLRLGVQTHSQALKRGFKNDTYVQNSLVHMYSRCGDLKAARIIFWKMENRDVVSWTSMVAGLSRSGDVESARQMFDIMPRRNLFTWSIMINGYAKNDQFDKSVELFQVLQEEGIRANETVMVSVIASCAHLGALELGQKAHDYVLKNDLTVTLILGTALVDMYSRCGRIDKAIEIFDELEDKDALCWTAIISGLAMHGYADKAVNYFSEMVRSGLDPGEITLTSVLSACSHGGLVDKGLDIFKSMKMEPRLEHYGCVVDMLGRAGKLQEAEKFLNEMPVKPSAPILGALLGACRIHKNSEIAERVGVKLLELQPQHSGYYVLLSNIYSRANKWENAERTRQMMKDKRITKQPGYSLIEIEGKIYNFTTGGQNGVEIEKIEKMWEEIVTKIRVAGYKEHTSEAFFDIDEEEKESTLRRHSEKLAIAFGIMRSNEGTPIRIVKNLRVCEDCHSATKFVSKIYKRELIVRDRNRFHHFRDGVCSCKDYW